jgi:3-oxoacyl-(acyl-carrier-protein) synthase
MKAAIKDAGIEPSAIDYVNAHGTSTMADGIEVGAVERALGDHAKNVAMSSTKSSIGHLLGAAGAVEAIFSALAIRDNIAPPTLNLDDPSVETAIDYVNAHGTSTMADGIEVGAVERALGDHAKNVAMSSTKSSIGHLLGAAGSVEAIFSLLAIRDQVAPPTINLENPNVETVMDLVPNKARPMKIDTVMSNSFGFGGTNAALIFKKFA